MTHLTDLEHLLADCLAEPKPDLGAALVSRGRLAIDGRPVDPDLDRRLRAHPGLAATARPDPEPILQRLEAAIDLAERHAPFIHPGASEEMEALVTARDAWVLQACGLEAQGVPSLTTAAAGLRDAAGAVDEVLKNRHDDLDVLAEVAAAALASAALGDQSGWGRFPEPETELIAEVGTAPALDPGDLIHDGELRAFLEGDASPLLATLVQAALEGSPALRTRLDALAGLQPEPQRDDIAPLSRPIPPPLSAMWRTDAAAPVGQSGPPEFFPPGDGTLEWVFPDESTLHLERAGGRWLVSVMPSGEDTAVSIQCEGAETWTDGDGVHRALVNGALVRVVVNGDRHLLRLGPLEER
jgi:hypothetical protein